MLTTSKSADSRTSGRLHCSDDDFVRRHVNRGHPLLPVLAEGAADTRLFGESYRALREPPGPPRLYVVVDTEAEFDWSKPFARHLVRVSNIAAQGAGQAVLERHGLRPIYVIDYPVATDPPAIAALRAIRERGACEIGAHLHPWTNPPFTETVSVANSYPGNLSPDLEEAKLVNLIDAIERGFGFRPRFYKAGRYGIGPNTLALITRHGIEVDFSILPGIDLRGQGGPDLRGLCAIPYLAGEPPILSLPMSRGHIGLFARFGRSMNRALDSGFAKSIRLRGVVSRIGAFATVSLTPEGVTSQELVRLATTLVRAGHKVLVMHYHSPSLAAGHTPYARTESDVAKLLERVDALCAHVLGPLRGIAGDPRDLLAAGLRPIETV